jgi:hypothetical protein
MNEEHNSDGSDHPKQFRESLDSWPVMLGVLFGLAFAVALLHYAKSNGSTCGCASGLAYNAIPLSALSVMYSAAILGASFVPRLMQQAAIQFGTSDDAVWHCRWSCRIEVISNIGYSMLMFAVGWFHLGVAGRPWQYFVPMFLGGLAIIILSKLVLWFRHKPYRTTLMLWHALTAAIFAPVICILIIGWVYEIPTALFLLGYYFDPFAVLVTYSLASILAQLCLAIKICIDSRRIIKSDSDNGELL